MSEPKFKVGDRVRFIGPLTDGDLQIGLKVGDTATVLQNDNEPWIRLDRLTNTPSDAEGLCEKGRGWVGYEEQLELIEPAPIAPTVSPTDLAAADSVAIAAWAKSALDGLPKLPDLRTPEADARFLAVFAGVRRMLEGLVQ